MITLQNHCLFQHGAALNERSNLACHIFPNQNKAIKYQTVEMKSCSFNIYSKYFSILLEDHRDFTQAWDIAVK